MFNTKKPSFELGFYFCLKDFKRCEIMYNDNDCGCRSSSCITKIIWLVAAALLFVVGGIVGALIAETILAELAAVIILAIVLLFVLVLLLFLRICRCQR